METNLINRLFEIFVNYYQYHTPQSPYPKRHYNGRYATDKSQKSSNSEYKFGISKSYPTSPGNKPQESE